MRPELQAALANAGYNHPTPIQAYAIPAVLTGRDVLATAQTGIGKTVCYHLGLTKPGELERIACLQAAYVLPIISRLQDEAADRTTGAQSLLLLDTQTGAACPLAVIVVPTRELCQQVAAVAAMFACSNNNKLVVHSIHGGVKTKRERRSCSAGVSLLVATPGRLVHAVADKWVRTNRRAYKF